MSSHYLIEVTQELITPIIVETNSQREAREKVFRRQGHEGDNYPQETQTTSVQRLDG